MELKKPHSRFASNLFLMKKSESESSATNKKCQGSDSDWVFRLKMIENQSKEIIQRYEDLQRQNDKIIQQNETILEMLETQMKLILSEKKLSMSNQGATTTIINNPNDEVQLSSQSLAISNPLYKYNNMTVSSSRMNDKSDGKQVGQQKASVKKSQPLQMGSSQPLQKISRAVAVWQVMKPSPAKASSLQEQFLSQLSSVLMDQGLRLEEGTHGPSLLTFFNSSNIEDDVKRDTNNFQGLQSQRFIIASFVPFKKVPPRWHMNVHATTCTNTNLLWNC